MILLDCRYEVNYNKKPLGVGAYAKVYRGLRKADRSVVAVKLVKLDNSQVISDMVDMECRILTACQHPNIIKCDGMFCTGRISKSIVLEFCGYGNLEEHVVSRTTNYTESFGRTICRTLLDSIHYLHSRNIVHCDIKPQNVLLASKIVDELDEQALAQSIRLADFGFAAVAEQNVLNHMSGSPPFHAPELVNQALYGKPVDMWAYGVTVFYLLSGKLPFTTCSQDVLNDEILHSDVYFPDDQWKDISDAAKGFICRLLTKSMDERLTAAQAILDPWVRRLMTFLAL
jgi:serine/threonine protein kinase